MSRKKLPSELTVEELLAQMELAPEPAPQEKEILAEDYKNDVLAFLHFYKITSGNEYVSTRLLHQIYKAWSKDPLIQRDFAFEMSKYLDRTHSVGYRINQKGINLSASAYRHYTENRARLRVQSAHYHRHFTYFMNFHEMKKGTTWVPWFVLYVLYDKWTYTNKTKTYVSADLFQAFLRVFFKRKHALYYTNLTCAFYAVSENIYQNIPPEQMSSIIEAYVKSGKNRKKIEKVKQSKKRQKAEEPPQ